MTFIRHVHRLTGLKNVLMLLALTMIIVSVMASPMQRKQPIYNFQIAFDISQSMQVKDVEFQGKTLSRLDRARQSASALLRALPCGSRIGWSVFTGRRTLTLLTPLDICEHYAGLLASLNEIDGSMRWANGSIIGKGIHQLMRAAHELDNDPSILFFSDGHEAPPMEQGQRGMPNTDRFQVKGLLVGIGGDTPVAIPRIAPDGSVSGIWRADEVVQKPGSASGEELSKRHDEHLRMLGALAQLSYHPMRSDQALIRAATENRFARVQESAYDFRWIPALIALILLFCRFAPSLGDLRSNLNGKWFGT